MNRNRSNEFLGMLLLVFGAVMIVKSLFRISIHLFFNGWWTLFIIIPSINSIRKNGSTKKNIAGLVIGVLLFLNCWGIFPLRIVSKLISKVFVPLFLIGVGVKLLSDGKKGQDDTYTTNY